MSETASEASKQTKDNDMEVENSNPDETNHPEDHSSNGEPSEESTSGSSSDEDSDDEHSDGDNRISAYEKLRLQRIERNRQRLMALGLESKDGGGVLGKKKSSQPSRRKNNNSVPTGPRRKSRRSTGNVDYSEDALLKQFKVASEPKAKKAPEDESKRKRRDNERPRDERMPLHIYKEFKRISKHKKDVLKQSERALRSAEREHKHWQKRAEMEQRKIRKELETKQALQQEEEEQKLFGCSALEFSRQLEERLPEIVSNIQQYDDRQALENNKAESEARREQHEMKLRFLVSMDAYPKAMKDATKQLNGFLTQRAPKDPPPPRRSKRNAEEEDNKPTKKRKSQGNGFKSESSVPQQPAGLTLAANPDEMMPAEANVISSPLSGKQEKSDSVGNESKKKAREPKRVGGWISPLFNLQIDRSWLARDSLPDRFDLQKYNAQVGDTVMYYPAGHFEFLQKYPDHLAQKRVSRMSLLDRALKERAKQSKAKSKSTEADHGEAAVSSPKSSRWWTDEWINSLGHYPIVCRVIATQPEFPPDPFANHKIVGADGQISWTMPSEIPAKGKKRNPLRLAVTLRPLTPVLPPSLTGDGLDNDQKLAIPPSFTIQTFPCPTLQPFLIPFAWGYIKWHTIALNDDVVSQSFKTGQKGKVVSFTTQENLSSGCFRMEEKLWMLAELLRKYDHEQSSSDTTKAKPKRDNLDGIPGNDLFILRRFMTGIVNKYNLHAPDSSSTVPVELDSLNEFIRCTLPPWLGLNVMRGMYDRRIVRLQFWDVKTSKVLGEGEYAALDSLKGIMECGLPRSSLDSELRLKLECTITDYLGDHPDTALLFKKPVTDELAPYYSLAVPMTMCFDRILARLKIRKTTSDEEPTCYYRSFDAVLSDLTAIHENCLLYNDATSPVVQAADDALPSINELLSSIAKRHFRERAEKLKADNEKRKFVMLSCNSSALVTSDSRGDMDGDSDRLQAKRNDPFREPFKGKLYRSWLEIAYPDVSMATNGPRFPQWVPQSGDPVMYSRSLHAAFVKGHFNALATNQCALPQFKVSSAEAHQNSIDKALSEGWLAGTIAWVRAEFPKKHSGVDEGTFKSDSPILAVALQFPSIDDQGSQSQVVYWRPCLFSQDISNADRNYVCSCGVPLATSFLCPSWADHFGRNDLSLSPDCSEGAIPSHQDLQSEEAAAIERNLSVVKWRCLKRLAPDYIDPDLDGDKVKSGKVLKARNIDMKSLPSYSSILEVDASSHTDATKTMTTRKVQSGGSDQDITELVDCNFLPPWLVPSGEIVAGAKIPLHDTISPWPKMCLELVHLRLRNGYYRQKAAVYNDIVEGYVTSVLLLLAPLAKRKRSPISIKKIAGALATRKYSLISLNNGISTVKKPQWQGVTDRKPADTIVVGGGDNTMSRGKQKNGGATATSSSTASEKHKDGHGTAKNGKKIIQPLSNLVSPIKTSKKPKSRGVVLSPEEEEILLRLEYVRRLYSVAVVCVMEIDHVQHLFGLTSFTVSTQKRQQSVVVQSEAQALAKGARVALSSLVAAISRDACANKHLMTSKEKPTIKLKIRCGGALVTTKTKQSQPAPGSENTRLTSDATLNGTAIQKPECGENIAAVKEPARASSAKPEKVDSLCQVDGGTRMTGVSENEGTQQAVASLQVETIQDCIQFGPKDYEGNDELIILLFKLKGTNRRACVRCEVRKRSMFQCRVVKGHSNIDFNLAGCFMGVGNLDDMISILHEKPSPQPADAASNKKDSIAEQAGEKAGIATALVEEETKTVSAPIYENPVAKALDASEKKDVENAENLISPSFQMAKGDKKGETSDVKSETATTECVETEQNQNSPSLQVEKGDKRGATNDVNSVTAIEGEHKEKVAVSETSDNIDPIALFKKAEMAVTTAKEVLASAKAYANAPDRLDEEFIACNFPFDQRDNHYSLCIICGLSGDLMCCDGDGCANVVHPTHVGGVPEGDWYCDCCVASGRYKAGMAGTNESDVRNDVDIVEGTDLPPRSNCDVFPSADETKHTASESNSAVEKTQGSFNSERIARHQIPPPVAFDEEKSAALEAVLDELCLIRTGRPRTAKEPTARGKDNQASKDIAKEGDDGSEETFKPSHSSSQRTMPLVIGTKFQKRFGRKYYHGEITSVPTPNHPFFGVRYEDGDEEDLSDNELSRLVSERPPVKKKRGRPRKTPAADAEVPPEKKQK